MRKLSLRQSVSRTDFFFVRLGQRRTCSLFTSWIPVPIPKECLIGLASSSQRNMIGYVRSVVQGFCSWRLHLCLIIRRVK